MPCAARSISETSCRGALPPERELADSLGVSRVTLREAIRVLQAEGYLQSRGGKRARLVLLERQESVDVLRVRLQQRQPDIAAILEYRQAVEGASARLAATRRTDEDLDLISGWMQACRESPDLPAFRRADAGFHLAIADAARNQLLRTSIEDARVAMFLPLDVLNRPLQKSSITQHQVILAAIRRGNGRAAERAMVQHVQSTGRDFQEALGPEEANTAAAEG